MVLENLVSIERIRKRLVLPFLLGILYASLSLFAAIFLFPDDIILFATALTSLLFLPTINRLLEIEKNIELKRNNFELRSFFKDHKDIFKIYLCIFLGIIITFVIFSFLSPVEIFPSGPLMFSDFFTIIGNNIKVLIVAYLASYFFGTGAIFIIAWNASIWGAVFGSFLRSAAFTSAHNPVLFFIILGISVLPYLIIEASAYFLAGISGGIVSRATISENIYSKNFEIIIKKSLFILWLSLSLVFVGAIIESQLAPLVFGLL